MNQATLSNAELTEKIHELQLMISTLGAKLNEVELHQHGYGGYSYS